jgi:hypothetical protein
MSTFERLPKENRDRRYRQRMFVENIDETRTITFGRDVHGRPALTLDITTKGHRSVQALQRASMWLITLEIWLGISRPKDRFGLGGARNPRQQPLRPWSSISRINSYSMDAIPAS